MIKEGSLVRIVNAYYHNEAAGITPLGRITQLNKYSSSFILCTSRTCVHDKEGLSSISAIYDRDCIDEIFVIKVKI